MTSEQKEWIDTASYEDLLRRWRFGKIGDPMFLDDAGDYYSKVMAKRRIEVGPGAHVGASKRIGWEG